MQRANVLAEFRHRGQHLVVEILAARVSFGADGLEADGVELPADTPLDASVNLSKTKRIAATPSSSGVSAFVRLARAVGPLHGGVVRADALDVAPGHNGFGGHFEQLALERRTADVRNEYLHWRDLQVMILSVLACAGEGDVDDALFDGGAAGMIGDDAVDAHETGAGELPAAHEHHPLPATLPVCRSGQINTLARPATSDGRLTFLAATRATTPCRVGIRRRCRYRGAAA